MERPFLRAPRGSQERIGLCRRQSAEPPAAYHYPDPEGSKHVDGIELRFVPTSLHCYTIGRNVLRQMH